jgi:hypothetical protein
MFKHETLLFAIFPSLIAIMLEAFNPLSKTTIERQAKEFIETRRVTQYSVDLLKEFTSGAVSVAGLAPTLMSIFAASLAILHDIPSADVFWWLYLILLLFIFVGLFITREVAQRGYYEMATSYINILGRPIMTYEKVHKVYVYALNFALLAVCAVLWRY